MRKLTKKEQAEYDALHPLEQAFYEPPRMQNHIELLKELYSEQLQIMLYDDDTNPFIKSAFKSK